MRLHVAIISTISIVKTMYSMYRFAHKLMPRYAVDLFRLEKRTEELTKAISTIAKDVTRVVVEIQDIKRQALLKHTRDALSAEVQVRKKWRQLIERLIHERYGT